MSHDGYHTVLVLGGIRSGKSEFAEGLVAGRSAVRYVATSAPDDGDGEWAARIAAHRSRRPADWVTEEAGTDPGRLTPLLAGADPGDTLIVDDLGGWVTAVLAGAADGTGEWSGAAAQEPVAALVSAVEACPGHVVVVSPEVGLSLVPTTASGRAFADAVGAANQALASVADAVVLVVAGQPTWLKGGLLRDELPGGAGSTAGGATGVLAGAGEVPGGAAPVAVPAGAGAPAATAGAVAAETVAAPRRRAVRAVAAPVVGGFAGSETVTLGSGTELPASADEPEINSRMSLPLPDETAAAVAGARLEKLDVPGAGLGNLAALVRFVAGTQGTGTPRPYRAPRLVLVHGAHRGGLATADTDELWQREVDRAAGGGGPLGILAGATGVPIQVVDLTAEPAEPIEESDATTLDKAEIGLRQGFRLAEAAVDTGTDLIILGAAGPGQVGAAAAVVSATVAVEPAAALPRVVLAGGRIDDNAWMARCEALRDGLRRAKGRTDSSVATIAALGGYDLAVSTGIILGATFRRTPVMIDGPVGLAAGMLARDLGAQSRLWLLLADDGRNPAVVPTARVIGTRTFADLRLDLGEGAAALAVLPVIQHALLLSTLSLADTEPDDSGDGDTDGDTDALTPAESSSAW